jgi:uridine kinase
MRSHIVGVAGPSSSGKSELAKHLAQRLPGTAIVSLDSYYRGMEEIPLEERKKLNFDHPDSLDWVLLHERLLAIAKGRPFDEPVYSFADYARTSETRRIEPTGFLIVERERACSCSTGRSCAPCWIPRCTCGPTPPSAITAA